MRGRLPYLDNLVNTTRRPTHMSAKIAAPQSESFHKQFLVLHALIRGAGGHHQLLGSFGTSPRHVAYALQALRLLRLLDDRNRPTPLGLALGARDKLDGVGWALIAKAVRDSTTIQVMAPGLGTPSFALSKEQLASRIADLGGYSRTTAMRRAHTLISWHKQLAQTPLPLAIPMRVDFTMELSYIRLIGSGGHGEVWHARDQIDRDLAVKFLFEDMVGHHDLISDARALARLDHPNVVRVVAVETLRPPLASALPRDPTTAIVMDYVPGRKLSLLFEDGVIPREDVERIGMALIRGFQALHNEGIVHEDLHAGNVLVSQTSVKIIDPYYQKSMRADSDEDQKRRLDSDIRALKAILSQLASHSSSGIAEWNRVQADFWNSESLPSVEECFTSYLLAVGALDEQRPDRGDIQIPDPGVSSMSNYTRFVRDLGFDEDPFFHTNAANEPRLHEYFIRPQYFRSLQADQERPSSGVVFAPRGSGKTAQALMLSEHAHSVGVLPIYYDNFPLLHKTTAHTPKTDYHLTNVSKLALTALLLYMEAIGVPFGALKAFLPAVGTLVFRLTRHVTTHDLRRLKVNPFLRGRLESLWEEQVASARSPGDFLITRWQGMGLQLQTGADDIPGSEAFEILKRVAQHLRFRGISVIIDRVDEADYASNNAERTFRLVEAILSELTLFDDPYVGWKVFLWDQCRSHLQERARTDRLPVFDLTWTTDDLRTMLSSRLETFSGGRVRTLSELASTDCAREIDLWPFIFASSSPRSLIRILQYSVREQIEIAQSPPKISLLGLERGIAHFCALSASETTDKRFLRQIRRIGRATFTISDVATAFKEEPNSSRSKVDAMVSAGVVRQLGTIKVSAGVKSSNYYMVSEPALIAYACPQLSVAKLMQERCKVCDDCGLVLFTDNEAREDALACPTCNCTTFSAP